MSDFSATLAAEPGTRRRGWPLLVLLHTALWVVAFGVLFAIVPAARARAADVGLTASGLSALVFGASAWLARFWPFALFGLAFWTGIDALVTLILSRDARGRGYLFWNVGQFLLPLGAILAALAGHFLALAEMAQRLSR